MKNPIKKKFSAKQWRAIQSNPDWEVDFSRENSSVTATFNPRFSLTTDYSLEIEDFRDFDDLCKKVRESYEGFDPDYETYLWLGWDGHGQNGAPYRIRDILDEQELIESKLSDLSRSLTCV